MAHKDNRFKIRLSREVEGTVIEVLVEDSDSIEEAYALLERVSKHTRIAGARNKIGFAWTVDDGERRMTEVVQESVYRVALSLFADWPKAKRVADILIETGLSQGSVSNILAGRQGGFGSWFERRTDAWILSALGVSMIMREVIPTILRQDMEEQ